MKKRRGNEGLKAQVSMEYLSIVGFVVIAVSIIVVISLFYSRNVSDSIVLNQVDRMAKEIVDTSEKVYYLGPPSFITIRTFMPVRVTNIQIVENQVVYTVRTQSGLSDIAYLSPVNITGQIDNSEGLREIRIESQNDRVYINGTIA